MNPLDEVDILWNKYKNVPEAYPGGSFLANQAVGNAFPQIIPNSQTWNSSIPATAPTDLGSVVSFTNGSYQQSAAYSWIRKYTVTMGAIQSPGISYWYASTDVNDPLTSNVCRDTIPYNFDPLGSYNIQVFANGTPVSPTYIPYEWNYDEAAGVLTFYPQSPSVLPPTPITMVYWRYVGSKGASALNYWTITDPPSGTNLNFNYLGTTKAIINSSGDITANRNLITKELLKITDQITTTNTWDIGSTSNGTLYFNYPTSIVDIIQLKATGSLQINGSASAFRAIDRTTTSRYMAWYANNDTLFWEYYNGSTLSTFMNFTNTGVFSGTATTAITASTGTQVIQTLFNPLIITNRVLYPAFWFNSLTGGSKALYGDNSISSLLTIRFETGAFGSSDPMFYTPNITNSGTIITTSITAGGSIGTSGQYLSSTGSGISWITPPTIPTVNNGTLTITNGTFMTGSGTFTANQAGNTSITIGTNATSANTASTIVARDATNNFSAGTITASLSGTATTANNIATTVTTATVYPTFVLNNTASASTPLLIDGGISYNATTNILTAIGGFAGTASRATAVATTAATTGTFYLPFVPLATTQIGQALNVKSQMFYVAGENQLNLGNTAGYVGGNVKLALLDNTIPAFGYNNLQIGISNNINASWFIGAQNDTGALGLFSIAPYGTAQDACFFITNSGIASSVVIEGRNCLQTYDRTFLTGSFTLYYTDQYKVDVENNGALQTRIWSNAIAGYPIPDGYTGFQIGNGTNGTQLILDDIITNKNIITNQSGNLRFWNDANDITGLTSIWDYQYQLTKYGKNTWYLNPSLGILLDAPVMNVDNLPLVYSSGITQTLNNFVDVQLQAGGNNIYTLTVKVSGNNPFGRTITISNQVALNFRITAVAGATYPTTFTITPSVGSQSATINGGAFTGYTYSTTGFGIYNYFQSAISVFDVFQPVGQSTWVITPTNTGNNIDTYVFTIDYNRASPTLTGVSVAARTGNLDGNFITLKGTSTTATFTKISPAGAITFTTSATPTNSLLSTVKSGTAGLLRINNAVDISATRVQNTLQTTGTQFLTMLPASATNTTTGQIIGTHAPLSYNVATSTLYSPNMNVVFYDAVFATSGIAYVPNIFTSDYTDYEITVSLVSPVSTGTTLSFDLITGTNTRLASGWNTLTSYVNGTAMVSLTPPTSLCYITSLPNSTHYFKHKCVMTNPRSVVAAKQFIAGLNVGYLTSTTQTTYTSTGLNSSTVSQTGFALIITGGGSWTGDVIVRGMNN